MRPAAAELSSCRPRIHLARAPQIQQHHNNKPATNRTHNVLSIRLVGGVPTAEEAYAAALHNPGPQELPPLASADLMALRLCTNLRTLQVKIAPRTWFRVLKALHSPTALAQATFLVVRTIDSRSRCGSAARVRDSVPALPRCVTAFQRAVPCRRAPGRQQYCACHGFKSCSSRSTAVE